METLLKAGAGVSILNFPDAYFPSDGYSGIHDDMHAKVLLLEQGHVRGAIVTLELPSVRPWSLTDELRAYSAKLLNVSCDQLWLVMTHDLSAPHVPKDPDGQALHMEVLRQAVAAAAREAADTLRPVTLSYCEGLCDVNANRDMESADGWWVGIHGRGPSDKTLSLLRFDDAQGKPIAVLYTYALKSSVLEETVMSDGKRYASGDVTGRAGVKAEKVLGCPVLFLMGAAGEQVPKKKAHYLALDESRHFYPVNLAEEGYGILEALSDELAQAVCAAAARPRRLASQTPLEFGVFSFHADGQVSYPNTFPAPPIQHYDYPSAPGEDIPVWFMLLGDTVLLGVKPEIVTPIFDRIKAFSPFAHTMMAVLVNGGQGYIAMDSDYDRFTYPGLKTPFRRGTDRVFLREIEEKLHVLWSIHVDSL